jgi:6-phosphogluconate dehydrogenase
MMIVIVGTSNSVDEFIPQIAPLLDRGVATVEGTNIVYSQISQDQ